MTGVPASACGSRQNRGSRAASGAPAPTVLCKTPEPGSRFAPLPQAIIICLSAARTPCRTAHTRQEDGHDGQVPSRARGQIDDRLEPNHALASRACRPVSPQASDLARRRRVVGVRGPGLDEPGERERAVGPGASTAGRLTPAVQPEAKSSPTGRRTCTLHAKSQSGRIVCNRLLRCRSIRGALWSSGRSEPRWGAGSDASRREHVRPGPAREELRTRWCSGWSGDERGLRCHEPSPVPPVTVQSSRPPEPVASVVATPKRDDRH